MESSQFPCQNCGADLKFAPGVQALECPYCGTANEVPEVEDGQVVELDYRAHLGEARAEKELHEVMMIKCIKCGSETTLNPNITADACAFCGTSYVQTASAQRVIMPQAQLPFKITGKEARGAYKKWIGSRWFAPNKLKKYTREEGGIQGMYIPHWTYDAQTLTHYTGRRGEYYYVTERYTAMIDGKPVQRTRQAQKTRWYPARGHVNNSFDDVIVPASDTLPQNYLRKLDPWDLEALSPYNDAYQSGFRTESYNIDLEKGFETAKGIMEGTIIATIHRDIGGDTQQILNKQTQYKEVSFKHILLPVWVSAYRFQDKVFRFLINARTGEVQGERPYSWVKITLLVLFIVLVIALLVMYS